MRALMTASRTVLMACALLLGTGSTASANALAVNGYSSSYAGESVFEGIAPGGTGQFSAIFFNDGTQAWSAGVVGLLICMPDKVTCNVASLNAAYASGWYSTTVYATVTSTVAPGQNGFFIYNFVVPAATPAGTVATFNGDVGLIATGAELRPEGYYQQNTTPAVVGTLTISPTTASVAVNGQQQFTATTSLTGSVSWSVTGGCGAVSASGLFVATATNSSSQPCTVVASTGSLTASAAVTVYGPASQLTCVASPASIIADGGGSGGTSTLTISVKDTNGNLVANSTPAITVTNSTPSLATLSQSGALAVTSGLLTVTVSSTTTQGQIVISATSTTTGITGCTALITSGAAGTATQTASSFVDDPTCTSACTTTPIAADGVSTSTLRVDIEDANGARTTDTIVINISLSSGAGVCTVTRVVTGTGGSFGGGTGTATTASGRVQFSVQSTTTPGACTFLVTPRTTGITSSSASLTTRLVGAATQVAVTKSTSPGSAGSASTTTVTVAIEDALGSRVSSATTTITPNLDSTSCTGAGGGNVVTTWFGATSGGLATFRFTSNGAYSGCIVTFTASGLSSTSATIVFTPGAADHLGCVFSPTVMAASGGSSVALVHVEDQANNYLTTGSYSVQFSLSAGSGVSSLQTTNPQTMTSGVATFLVRATGPVGTDTYTPSLYTYTRTLPNIVANHTCVIAAQ